MACGLWIVVLCAVVCYLFAVVMFGVGLFGAAFCDLLLGGFVFVYMVGFVCWNCLFWFLLGVVLIACYLFEVLRLFVILLFVVVLFGLVAGCLGALCLVGFCCLLIWRCWFRFWFVVFIACLILLGFWC